MSAVTLWCLLICFWSHGVKAINVNQCIRVWEIETPYSAECMTKNLASRKISLQLESNSGFVEVSSCHVPSRCTDHMPSVYTTSYFGRRDIEGDEWMTMSVHISGVREAESKFRCVFDYQVTDAECLEMYVKPSKPVCDPPTLVNSNTQLNITCTSDKVYPDAFMRIALIQDGMVYYPNNYELKWEDKVSVSLTYPGYGVSTDTALITVSSLEPNTYQFVVGMAPSTFNETLTFERESERTLVTGTVLTVPEVSLPTECLVDGYVTSGTCKCELSTPGNPPGQARWYTESGQVVGTENVVDRSSTLIFSMYSEDASTSYECRAETLLNVSSTSTVSLVPKFPSGPNFVIIESSVTDGIFNLCPSEEYITISVTCKVPTEDLKPGATFTILVNNDLVVDQQDGTKTATDYYYHYSFRPSKGGRYSVECRAQNSLASRLSPSEKLNFEVREPPSSPPVFHIPPNQPGSDVANVTLGKTIGITCKVDGGYRKVSEVNVLCGSKERQVQGSVSTLTLEVTQLMEGQICICSATHDSGCYFKESEVLLKVVSEDAKVRKEDKDSGPDQTLIIVLPVIASIVIIALVVVIVILFVRKRKRSLVPPINDATGQYPAPSNAVQDGYITPVPPASNNYATVIVNDDWSYNNPTFTASHEYDRLSNDYDQVSAVLGSTSEY